MTILNKTAAACAAFFLAACAHAQTDAIKNASSAEIKPPVQVESLQLFILLDNSMSDVELKSYAAASALLDVPVVFSAPPLLNDSFKLKDGEKIKFDIAEMHRLGSLMAAEGSSYTIHPQIFKIISAGMSGGVYMGSGPDGLPAVKVPVPAVAATSGFTGVSRESELVVEVFPGSASPIYTVKRLCDELKDEKLRQLARRWLDEHPNKEAIEKAFSTVY